MIASLLGRAPSTVSREIRRNGGQQIYRANIADRAAWDRAHRPKTCKLAGNPDLASIVAKMLKKCWSPEQIAGWLKRTYPDNENLQVSHETIYRTLFIQARSALKKSYCSISDDLAQCVARGITLKKQTTTARSVTQSLLVNDLLRWRIVQYRVIGKAISSSVPTTARSLPWLSATLVT